MAYEIGVFDSEQQAIDAVRALEAEGFSNHAIRVFAKDYEHSRRIETETNVHADEVLELAETRNSNDDGFIGVLGAAANVIGGSYIAGTPSASASAPYVGSPVIGAAALFGDDDSAMTAALRDLGLSGDAAATCRDALSEGAYIVAADIGASSANDGPSLTTAGTAEAVFRRIGARTIV